MRFQVRKWHFEVEKTVNACVEMSCYVSPSAGICFTGNGLRSTWLRVLTGVFSYFQLFEPCMTGTAGEHPHSTRAKGMQNGVSGFKDSHFSWRRPRGVNFGGQ